MRLYDEAAAEGRGGGEREGRGLFIKENAKR